MVGQEITIDVYLRRLRLEVTQLPVLASMIAEEPPDVRDVWHWQWDELMHQLTALCEQCRLHRLTADQERQFLELTGQLEAAKPALQALGLCIPEEAGPRFATVELTPGESIEV